MIRYDLHAGSIHPAGKSAPRPTCPPAVPGGGAAANASLSSAIRWFTAATASLACSPCRSSWYRSTWLGEMEMDGRGWKGMGGDGRGWRCWEAREHITSIAQGKLMEERERHAIDWLNSSQLERKKKREACHPPPSLPHNSLPTGGSTHWGIQ